MASPTTLQPGESIVVTAADAPPPPPPPPVVTVDDVLGPGCRGQSKGNVQTQLRQEIVFRAQYTGLIVAVRVSLRGEGGSTKGYSLGNGGPVNFAFTDVLGQPIGSTGSITPGNPSGPWTTYPEILVGCPVVAGEIYRCVVTGGTAKDFVSLNHLFNWDGAPPNGRRQPRFPTGDWDLLVNGSIDPKHSAVAQFRYADGSVQGQAYVGMIGGIQTLPGASVSYGVIGGSKKVRSTWQVTERVTLSSLYVGGLRCQTAAPIHVSLWGPSGELLDLVSPAVATSQAGGDNGGTVFAGGKAPSRLTLDPGAYQVRLSSTGLWSAAPIREGTEYGFDPRVCWPAGKFQVTNDGVSFTDPYAGLDLQWYGER